MTPPDPSRPQRAAVVYNPIKVDIDRLRDAVAAAESAAGWAKSLWLETSEADPGIGQARQALAERVDVVIAAGGDGTVRAVAQGLQNSGIALSLLPSGTGNLLAANLGLGGDPATGVQVALDGGRRRIDVGTIEDRCFVVMAGMGFDAQMLEGTSETAKKAVGWLAYVGGALKHLRDRPMRVRIRLDDGPPMPRRPRSVIVGNVGRLQGGVRLLTEAEPDDGKFDVAILSPSNLRHWISLGLGVILRRPRAPLMETFTAERVTIVSNRRQPRQLDGDLIDPGRTLRIGMRRRALLLCVPQPDSDPDLAYDAEAAARAAEPVRAAADEAK